MIFKLSILLLLIFCSLFCLSCSKSNETVGFPDFSNSLWFTNYNNVLYIEKQTNATWSDDLIIMIMTKAQVDSVYLSINSIPMTCTFGNHWEGMQIFQCSSDSLSIKPDSVYSYNMEIGVHTYSGSLLMPSDYIMDYPLVTWINDYTINWELDQAPSTQVINYDLSLDNDNSVSYTKQFDSQLRTFTVPKEKFENAYDFSIYIQAINTALANQNIYVGGCCSTQGHFQNLSKNIPLKKLHKNGFIKLSKLLHTNQ